MRGRPGWNVSDILGEDERHPTNFGHRCHNYPAAAPTTFGSCARTLTSAAHTPVQESPRVAFMAGTSSCIRAL